MKTIDELIKEQTREYHNNCSYHLDDTEAIAFKIGAIYVRDEMQKEIEKLKEELKNKDAVRLWKENEKLKAYNNKLVRFIESYAANADDFEFGYLMHNLGEIKKEMGKL
jgi:hypothetical protein